MEPPRRRRPPAPAAPGPDSRERPGRRPPGGHGRLRLITAVGLVVALVVIAGAFITGTAGDLPWGAIIGVAVVLGAMAVTARRRERRMREAFPDDEDD